MESLIASERAVKKPTAEEPARRPPSSPIRAAAPCITDRFDRYAEDRYAEDECESETSSAVAAGAAGAVKPGRLAVMRHSVRLDSDPAAGWPDRQERPYDTPISDYNLPAEQATLMKKQGLGDFDLIVCSPFRRCLQTAGIVAQKLGIHRVSVHRSLGNYATIVLSRRGA